MGVLVNVGVSQREYNRDFPPWSPAASTPGMNDRQETNTNAVRVSALRVEWQGSERFPVEVTQSAGYSGNSHPGHLCHTGLVCGRDDEFIRERSTWIFDDTRNPSNSERDDSCPVLVIEVGLN